MEIKEKLERFERYIKRLNFNYINSKKNMIFRFHEIFYEEMKNTKSGIKWEKSLDK